MLRSVGEKKQRILTGGNFTKHRMAGPVDADATTTLLTRRLNRILCYEPRDLTISVEAGLPFRELQNALSANRQMVPLDPTFADSSTVGGVVAANISGPRRRQYGTARDMVIGMEFATVNGRLVQSGGMVVKNVAGLDMAKLLIGSFGTLGVITKVNFKLFPIAPAERTFAIEFATAREAVAVRDAVIRGPVQPVAIDLMNPMLASEHGLAGWTLLLRFGGNERLMERCEREMVSLGPSKTGKAEFWKTIESLSEQFLVEHDESAVVRISCLLEEIGDAMGELAVPAIARAGTGVIYAFFSNGENGARFVRKVNAPGRLAWIESASPAIRSTRELWPSPGSGFAIMKKIKHLFDPDLLLNRGRFYRHF